MHKNYIFVALQNKTLYLPSHSGSRMQYEGQILLSRVGKMAHPAMLTSEMKEVATIAAMVRMHRAHESHLDQIHVSAC